MNELSALARSWSPTRFTTFAISDGYMNAMPAPMPAAPSQSAHGSATELISTRDSVSVTSAMLTVRWAPNRSGTFAASRRSDRLTALYTRNRPAEPASPTSREWSGMNAKYTDSAAMPVASTTPGQSAARWKSGAFAAAGAAVRSTRRGTPSTVNAVTSANADPTRKVVANRSSPSTASPMVGPMPMPPNTATEK